jgi:lipoprotein-anchoring transpeptidase ErfK/SrfK
MAIEYGWASLGRPRKHLAAEPEPIPSDRSRVYAKARFVWIRKKPDPDAEWLGYVTLGQSLAVRTSDYTAGLQGTGTVCERWVPVQPEGWVCVGRDATLEPNDPVVRSLAETAPDTSSPWPYDYARSLEAPRYRTIPSMREQRAVEGDVAGLIGKIERARAAKTPEERRAIDPRLTEASLETTSEPPPELFPPPYTILESDTPLKLGSTIAYTRHFEHDGRAWLLSWDRAVIPAVRTRLYPRSAFRGVELGAEWQLPIAFTKKSPAPRYRIENTGEVVRLGDDVPAQTAIALEPSPQAEGPPSEWLATKEPGVFLERRDVVLVESRATKPRRVSGGRETWVEVSTVGGWLIAYEGDRPVYATLISAGKGEILPSGTMRPTSSTPQGTWSIASKLRTATMRSDRRPDMVHAEVMYTQVFFEDYALHGAYWHDEWGDRRSAGCVNLAPIDAKWIFDWSEPALPPDWHARRTLSGDPSTAVVVHD